MKRFTLISFLALTLPVLVCAQNQNTSLDDIYIKPSDASKIQQTKVEQNKSGQSQAPKYKNGAREIVYIERKVTDKAANDSSVVLAQINDTLNNNEVDTTGYYLNGFKGDQSELEYATRIRKFHNPKYTIFIGDPRYNDIYFLNDNDWNVYVDGSYAYVTPTWTNPYWFDYQYRPYSSAWGYNGYGYGYPYGYQYGYSGYYGGWNSYYGFGYGYYGSQWPFYTDYYCGWGYPYGYDYYGYGGYGYGGYYGGGWSGKSTYRNPAHNEASRRSVDNTTNPGGRYGDRRNTSQTIAGGDYSRRSSNPYTVVSGSGSRSSLMSSSATSTSTLGRRSGSTSMSGVSTDPANRLSNSQSGIRTSTNGYSTCDYSNSVRTSGSRSTSIENNAATNINTRPRTATVTNSGRPSTDATGVSRSTYSTGSATISGGRTSSGSRSTTYTPTYSSGSRSSSNSSGNSPSYSSPSYTPSYSGGSSSSSSGGGGGGGGGSRSSSGGGNSAGSRR